MKRRIVYGAPSLGSVAVKDSEAIVWTLQIVESGFLASAGR